MYLFFLFFMKLYILRLVLWKTVLQTLVLIAEYFSPSQINACGNWMILGLFL